MSKQIDALKLALDALERLDGWLALRYGSGLTPQEKQTATAIKEALAQPEQGPVAFEEWLSNQHGDPEEIGFLQALRIAYISGQDSITTPPQRNPLSPEQIAELDCFDHFKFARAIEAAHGIKE